MTKNKFLRQIANYIAIIIGTFLLSFGAVIFLEHSNLVAGGVSGIAIVVQSAVRAALNDGTIMIYDYVVYGLMVVFWVLGLIFLKEPILTLRLLCAILFNGVL